MIRVAIACTAAATAVVAFYGLGETKAKDWILTGIPTWFQGIGTLAAALVGYWALMAWRAQELEKRKADLAERILRSAFVASGSIQDFRVVLYMDVDFMNDPLNRMSAIGAALSEDRDRKVEALLRNGDELLHQEAFGKNLFGDQVAEDVKEIAYATKLIVQSYNALKRLQHTPVERQWANRDAEAAKRHLAHIGVHGINDRGEYAEDEDEMSSKIGERLKRLETTLTDYITYRAK